MKVRDHARFGARILSSVALAGLVFTGCCDDVGNSSSPTTSGSTVDLTSLARRSGYGVFDTSDGRCVLLSGSGLREAVPIASAFKLWVLDAVARAVVSGTTSWTTSVTTATNCAATRQARRTDTRPENRSLFRSSLD
jgi:hypothetical protein